VGFWQPEKGAGTAIESSRSLLKPAWVTLILQMWKPTQIPQQDLTPGWLTSVAQGRMSQEELYILIGNSS
jgi:hypothetical protein